MVSSSVGASASWSRVLEVLPEAVLIIDDHDSIQYVSALAAKMAGQPQEHVGASITTLVPLWGQEAIAAPDKEVKKKRRPPPDVGIRVLGFVGTNGQETSLEAKFLSLALNGSSWTVVALRSTRDGAATRSKVAGADLRLIDAQFTAAVVLAESEERFRHSFNDNMAPMMFTDLDNCITEVNAAFCRMIGRSREELLGSDSVPFTYPEDLGISEVTHRRFTSDEVDQARYVKRYLHRDGRVIIAEISKSTARDADGKMLYFVLSERDITEERALSAQLSHQALHDPLTGLANRAVFEDRLSHAQARVARLGGIDAVLLMDLDDFKGVNDSHGHLVGDQVLMTLAQRLEKVTRASDTLCRFGGDEFLYLAEGLGSPEEVDQLASRLLGVFNEPIPIPGTQLEIHASIGVVVWDGTTTDYTQVVQNADSAMYEAKRRGKGHYVIFSPNMEQQAVSRFALAQELRHALHAGELSMHYQPILSLESSTIVGFEALMRWQHPERGWVPPSVFISLAEQSDLILELGAFALREAVAAASTWKQLDGQVDGPFVTVNFSSRQFHDPELLSMIVTSLMSSGLSPECLVIEITESVTLNDVAETLNVIEHLHRLEIGVALDDFGTGYSSLSYLSLLHPKILKIDRSFVSPAHEDIHNDTLLETIVSLGQKLNMTVLAEGIETSSQLKRLRELGCDLGQGFLYSPAVPLSEASAMLTGTTSLGTGT
jgi:diguanylate cyclase (GGDEF)-like protein/PAS domain S-box-containing protein